MATLHAGPAPRTAEQAERRLYMYLAIAMTAVNVIGFSLNLVTGRSTFAVPPIFHAHAVVFMGWLALWTAQAVTIATGRRALHIRLGKIAWAWVPLMVVLGIALMITVARTTGGPFFFAVNEFLIGNIAGLLCFGFLALWSMRIRRHTGWHRRLMFSAVVILLGPGIGRILPMPLLIPNAWTITFAVTLIFPAIAMVADLKRYGRVHRALWWGTGINVAVFLGSLLVAHTPVGLGITHAVIDGTPGAERPMQSYMPPGFKM